MDTILQIFISLVAGAAAGMVYFGGLWWTVRRLPDAGHPTILMLFSFLIRISIALGVFYLAGDGQWPRILSALIGLLLVRHFLIRYLGPDTTSFSVKGVRS
jgi:F1F0 ATPase subunit 2